MHSSFTNSLRLEKQLSVWRTSLFDQDIVGSGYLNSIMEEFTVSNLLGVMSTVLGFKKDNTSLLIPVRERRVSSVVEIMTVVGDVEEFKNTKVTFDPQVQVLYIPTAAEYKSANLSDLLWWKQSELLDFRNCAAREVESAMSLRPELLLTKPSLKMLDDR